ncbi:MAG: hypothetical protein Q8R28_18895 [Dehalococcoidia bacterium]|nr:hypothetical protein [Dehalococcoidia bacterium]
MKRFRTIGVGVTLVMILVAALGSGWLTPGTASAAQPPGKLAFNLNIIGMGNYGHNDVTAKEYTGNGDANGSRHTIFIPLKTTWYTDPCETDGGQNNPTTTLAPDKGVKMSIVAGDSFSVLDGDATDGAATFQMPSDTAKYDIYAVAKGKPGGCLDLEAYTYLDDTLIFLGSVDVDRGRAKPGSVNLNNLLYLDGNGVALFADPYEDYFWQLYNNGLRLMNIRFYER